MTLRQLTRSILRGYPNKNLLDKVSARDKISLFSKSHKRGDSTMKGKSVGMTVCLVLIALFTAPVAFGQALGGKWFELKVSFKGYAFAPNGLDKVSGSTTNYLHLSWNGSAYEYSIYALDGTQIPQHSPETSFVPDILEYYETARDVGMTFARDEMNYIDVWQTAIITIKKSKDAFKSATFTSLGCEVEDGEMEGETAFGGCTIKGKMIDSPPFL